MDIVISDLTKSYGENLVINKFNGVIKYAERTFVMGPSGCGKSTLINILMGITPYDDGNIQGVPELKSVVFQEDRLCEAFNAVSNVKLVCSSKVKDEEIIFHIEQIGLKDDIKKPVIELSGGMRRRVVIVRAILADSEILFLDEPFKGLDNVTKKNVMSYIIENTKNKTTIIVTHDIEDVNALGGQVMVMGASSR